jgi:hypothetical protein
MIPYHTISYNTTPHHTTTPRRRGEGRRSRRRRRRRRRRSRRRLFSAIGLPRGLALVARGWREGWREEGSIMWRRRRDWRRRRV